MPRLRGGRCRVAVIFSPRIPVASRNQHRAKNSKTPRAPADPSASVPALPSLDPAGPTDVTSHACSEGEPGADPPAWVFERSLEGESEIPRVS